MSIWATRLTLDTTWQDEHPSPLIYHGSHAMPSREAARGGSLDTAHIPGFLTRNGYDDAGDGEDQPWWPFLRLAVRPAQRPDFDAYRRLIALADQLAATHPTLSADVRAAAGYEDTVVLDVDQVDALIADLTEWRAGVGNQQ